MIDIFGKIPKFVTTLSVLVLFLAVIHDWGYFFVAGSKFQELQTPYDFLANSIEWLPFGVIILCFYGAFFALLAPVFLNGIKPPQGFPDVIRATYRRRRLIAVTFLGLLAAAIVVASWREPNLFPPWMIYPTMFLLTAISGSLIVAFLGTSLRSELKGQLIVVLWIVLTTCTLALYEGLQAAGYDLYGSTSNIYRVELKSGPPKLKKILRPLEKGLLTYDPLDQTTTFVRWEEVKSVTHDVLEDDQGIDPNCANIGLFLLGRERFYVARKQYLASHCVPSVFAKP